jgi:putative ATP-binding cassette transporter
MVRAGAREGGRLEEQKVRISRLIWLRLWRAVGVLLKSEVGGRATALFATMFVLLLAMNGLNVVNSFVARDFMTSIEQRDLAGFWRFALLWAGVFALSTLALVMARFAEERLDLLWRRWLTSLMIHSYLGDRVYFRLNASGEVTNPDQRIAEDVRFFSTTALSFVVLLTNGLLSGIGFAGVLWSISPLLFVVAFSYAAIGSAITWLLGRPLVDLNYVQSDREANLRSDLIHLRENADLVALLRREERLRTRMLRRLESLVANTKRVIAVNRNVGFFTNGYNYAIQIIPILIVAPLYFRDQIEFGVITQSAMAFSQLVGAISILITQFGSISSFAAVLGRLSGLSEAVEGAHREPLSKLAVQKDEARLAWEGVQLAAPDGAPLVRDLTVQIPAGGALVYVLGNAAARNALYRATADLWPGAEGRVARPDLEQIGFLTERPYVPPGTLRELLVRSWEQDAIADAAVEKTLAELGIESVLERAGDLDTEQNWSDLLSLGEQQLVAIARLLLANARFALLDRLGGALDADQRARVLQVLRERGVTVVLFEDCAPEAAGDAALEIADDGAWTWSGRLRE